MTAITTVKCSRLLDINKLAKLYTLALLPAQHTCGDTTVDMLVCRFCIPKIGNGAKKKKKKSWQTIYIRDKFISGRNIVGLNVSHNINAIKWK